MVVPLFSALSLLQHNSVDSPLSSSLLLNSSFSIVVIAALLGAIVVLAFLAYSRIKRLASELKAANRAKLDFLTTMSHELRTPLNAISGYTDLLLLGLRGPLTQEQRDDLTKIHRNQRQLLTLINDVLNFAKIDVGAVQYALADIRLDTVVSTASLFIEQQILEKDITFEVFGLHNAVLVRADDEKLYQILVNLLSNAVKFTKPNGHITVRCTQVGDVVQLAVSDTGIGIPREKLTEIFDPFTQVDTSLTREHSGVGLGLSISRNLALGMSGDLIAESTIGKGSTFTLILPSAFPINPSAAAALPDTYTWPDHSTLRAPVSQHALVP